MITPTPNHIVEAFTYLTHNLTIEAGIKKLEEVKEIIRRRHSLLSDNISLEEQPIVYSSCLKKLLEEYQNMSDHQCTKEQLMKMYGTDILRGLSSQEANNRLQANSCLLLSRPYACLDFLKEMFEPFSIIIWVLMLFAGTAFGISGDSNFLMLAIILLITVLSSTGISYYFNRKSKEDLNKVENLLPKFGVVLRDGKLKTIKSENIVVGDIVYIKEGSQIPVDLRILQTVGMKIDNSILTGQNEPFTPVSQRQITRSPLESKNMVFSGSISKCGIGMGLAIKTGKDTLIGRLLRLISLEDSKVSWLQAELSLYAKLMMGWSLCIGVITMVGAIIIGFEVKVAAMISIGVLIASQPGGLNLVLLIIKTMAVVRMGKKNMVCKNLNVLETLGSVTCLCSDKTGTLTDNKMSVSRLFFNCQQYKAESRLLDYSNETFKFLHLCAVLSSSAQLSEACIQNREFQNFLRRSNINPKLNKKLKTRLQKQWLLELSKQSRLIKTTAIGDPTESSLIKYFDMIEPIVVTRRKHPLLISQGVECRKQFNPEDRYSLCLVCEGEQQINCDQSSAESDASVSFPLPGKGILCYRKGAPQLILNDCKFIMINGEIQTLQKNQRKRIQNFNNLCGSKGERVLGFSLGVLKRKKNHPRQQYRMEPPNFPLNNQIYLGSISITDAPKKGMDSTIIQLRTAGVKVIMITGDQQATATQIARRSGIITSPKTVHELMEQSGCSFQTALLKSPAVVINGQKLLQISLEDQILPPSEQGSKIAEILKQEEIVFCRIDPSQKLYIVEALQKLNHVVAVTGDGINDSPAIKYADVGLCMGSGADATKAAAGIILEDDDLNNIVLGLQEGRKIYDNLRKSICYVMTSQISESIPFIILITFKIPIPIFTLLIDFAADFLPAMCFAFEPSELGILTRRPRGLKEHLVSCKLLAQASGWMGFSSFMCSLCCYYFCMLDFGFVTSELLGKSNIPLIIPADSDYYNPTNSFFGNSNLALIKSCRGFEERKVGIDWINSSNPKTDLRQSAVRCIQDSEGVHFRQNMVFGECRVQQISVYTNSPVCFTTEAAKYGQTAYMLSNVISQMFNLFICRTRRSSVFKETLTNRTLYLALTAQVLLALLLTQAQFMNRLIGTRDVLWQHYGLVAIPFGITQLCLDEIRKYIIRLNVEPELMHCKISNWFQRHVMW